MLFHELCCTKSTPPLGAVSSTNMHWCAIRVDTHGVAAPTLALVPVSVVASHWLGSVPQLHGTHAPTVAPTSGGLSPNLQYSLAPRVASLPIVHWNVSAARLLVPASGKPSCGATSTRCGTRSEEHTSELQSRV